ncbi:MAG: DUF2892 domain-containing protein [Saprospiraceae bacterium]|nr:DUF2892 domain-containing protein [Bacteroidia bacterium]NNF20918.1 DUF2892 domain-containing protein [Saprospiraceae bacterium]
MTKNVGVVDRIIRFVAMDLLLGFTLMGFEIPGYLTNICFIISIYLGFTVLFGLSPIYHFLKISTIEESGDPID